MVDKFEEIQKDDRGIYIINNMEYVIFKSPVKSIIEKEIYEMMNDNLKFIIRLYKKDMVLISEFDYRIEGRKKLEGYEFEKLITDKNDSLLGYLVVDLVVIKNILITNGEPINNNKQIELIKGLNERCLESFHKQFYFIDKD